MRSFALGATLILLLGVPGCGDRQRDDLAAGADTAATRAGEGVRAGAQEATGAVEGPREFTFDDRQDFAQSMRQQLEDADQRIEELASQAKSAGGAVSDRALANIRAARQAVNRNLARVDEATADNWAEIRRGVEEAMDHLDEAVERAQPK